MFTSIARHIHHTYASRGLRCCSAHYLPFRSFLLPRGSPIVRGATHLTVEQQAHHSRAFHSKMSKSRSTAATAAAALLALGLGLSSIPGTSVNAALAEPPADKFVLGEFALTCQALFMRCDTIDGRVADTFISMLIDMIRRKLTCLFNTISYMATIGECLSHPERMQSSARPPVHLLE